MAILYGRVTPPQFRTGFEGAKAASMILYWAIGADAITMARFAFIR